MSSNMSDEFWQGLFITIGVMCLFGLIASIVVLVNSGSLHQQHYEQNKFKTCLAAQMQWVDGNCVKTPIYVPSADQCSTS